MPKSLHERVVARARELITRPESWVQFRFALTTDGRGVHPTDPDAAQFCAVGALIRASAEITGRVKGAEALAGRIEREVMRFAGESDWKQMTLISAWKGHFAVLTLFDMYLFAYPAMASLPPPRKAQPSRKDSRVTVH